MMIIKVSPSKINRKKRLSLKLVYTCHNDSNTVTSKEKKGKNLFKMAGL